MNFHGIVYIKGKGTIVRGSFFGSSSSFSYSIMTLMFQLVREFFLQRGNGKIVLTPW